MADIKYAATRYRTLDRCFRNPGRRYFIEDLLNEVNEVLAENHPGCTGIQLRQLRDDIRYMKSEAGGGVPIETLFEGKKAYYRYSDLSFSITNQPINEKEAQQLTEAMNTLMQFKGLPQFEWVDETMVRLKETFHLKDERKVIEFEENIYLKGREHLAILYNAIRYHRTMQIHYVTFKGIELDVTISPYYLKEYNNRWFLFAFSPTEDKLMNLALDRIEKIEETKEEFIPNIEFDFEEYFEDVLGVTIVSGLQPEKITLKIDAQLWPYIKTKPIHGSQKVIETNEQFTVIQLELIPNYELEARIFSFGDQIEVLAPEILRNKLAERISRLKSKYFE